MIFNKYEEYIFAYVLGYLLYCHITLRIYNINIYLYNIIYNDLESYLCIVKCISNTI